MKIVVASDKAGFELKEKMVAHLAQKGHAVQDVGLRDAEGYMTFFTASENLARMIQKGEAERGVLICGTGAGMCINANKYEGVFAVACESVYSARMCRVINDANVMTMGGNILGPGLAADMCDVFLATEYLQGMPEDRTEYLIKLGKEYKQFLADSDFSRCEGNDRP